MANKINVSVEIGYELRTVQLTEEEWDDVNKGEFLSKSIEDNYEGEVFVYEYQFHADYPKDSTLYVTNAQKGDFDGGQGFVGNIEDAIIEESDFKR